MSEEAGQPGAAPGPDGERQPRRGFLAGAVALGALLAVGSLWLMSNATNEANEPGANATDPFSAFGTKSKVAKVKGGKAAKAGKERPPPPPRVPPAHLWISGGAITRDTAPPDAKNLVVVVWTAVRRDALTPYGAPPDRTPYLAELAAGGAKFADLIAASSFSRTSATAMLTGQHAAELDMVDPGPGPEARVLPAEVDTLAERLRAAGWQTIGLTANFNLNTTSGLAQGFDRYRNAQANSFHPAARIDGQRLVTEALGALDARSPEDKARPFYLQLDFVDAHAPLRADPAFDDLFDPTTPNHLYRVAVNRLDGLLRDLVTELAGRGYVTDSNTYVVVLTDHGEGNNTPEHHGKMHGRLLYDTLVSAPWVVAGPDVPHGLVVSGLASHTDVTPTLLDLVGIAPPTGIDGQDLGKLLRGEVAPPHTARTRAFADTWYFNANRASLWTDTTQCQKDFGSVGITDAFADGCFDRRTDPEFRNLKQDPALMAELVAWREAVGKHVTTTGVSEATSGGEDDGEAPPGEEGEGDGADGAAADPETVGTAH